MFKKITFILLIVFAVACNSETQNTESQVAIEESTFTLSEVLADISSLEKEKKENPITLFQQQAENKATEIKPVTKENIKEIIAKAKTHKHCFITTSNHTIVRFSNLNKCKPSGSWAACMPVAKGYIKKGTLLPKEDYINNIFGVPDTQERTAYFFN